MTLIWSPDAQRDLRDIRTFIAHDSPRAADRVAARLVVAAEQLLEFPLLGRSVEPEGTRELVVAGTAYVLVYRVTPEAVEIGRVMHGAQQRAPEER